MFRKERGNHKAGLTNPKYQGIFVDLRAILVELQSVGENKLNVGSEFCGGVIFLSF
jgi:hypothetical protein